MVACMQMKAAQNAHKTILLRLCLNSSWFVNLPFFIVVARLHNAIQTKNRERTTQTIHRPLNDSSTVKTTSLPVCLEVMIIFNQLRNGINI